MALNWNLTKIKNHKECLEDGFPWTLANALIWSTMAVELGQITKKNYKEFHARVAMWEFVVGPMIRLSKGEYEITEKDVHRHIGLKTNVQNISDNKFDKKIGQLVREKITRRLNVTNDDWMWMEENHEDTDAMGR